MSADGASASNPKLEAFREYHMLEKHRLESFKCWPFPAKSSCSVAKMAEAGFYWTGTERDVDTATCFVCGKTLDGWESDDDPWKEHLKHAPQCEFAKLNRAEKDLTVAQFLKIFAIVIKHNLQKQIKEFKSKFDKENKTKLNEFVRNQS